MRVHFLGVRGSTPAPGAEFARYGGHTSCVAVETDDGRVPLVLDAGTGLSNLDRWVDGAFVGTILMGHLHWDHTHGLPFAPVVDHPDAVVSLRGPASDGLGLDERLSRAMSPPNFPIGPHDLRGSWDFVALEEGRFAIDDIEVTAREIPHKGGRTYGYRVEHGGRSVAYLSDHAPQQLGPGPDALGEYHDAALELARGVDLLVHDAQYTVEELPTRGAFGHAAAEYAVALGRRAGVGAVALFHHDPRRTDDEVDAIVARFAEAGVLVVGAAEGMTLDL